MAFSFGASAGGGQATQAGQVGPELEQIETEALGFSALKGDSRIRLLPTAWPSNALPPPTSSLLSIASTKGLLAAAGPDALVVARTTSVRGAFSVGASGDSNVKSFQPELTIPLSMRVSHVAFSADETYLAISAEQGGGIAVYEVESLLQGKQQTAFELSTNGTSLRALVPNPARETAEFVAIVTTDGNLMMANLKQRQILAGGNGQILKDGVSCVTWSTRGKQIVAGLGNGTACQMTPSGEVKAEIPAPSDLEAPSHVSSIYWLENHVFFVVHTPTSFDPDTTPNSAFHLITRDPPSSTYLFQKAMDPCPPFGLNRSPPFHFVQRLKNYEPHLQDLLILASTGSTDVGLLSRASKALAPDMATDRIINVFTTTGLANDSRRAQLPMTEDASDTSPIGVALDLSSTDLVERPIPTEEMDKSATPLPALSILNNEGMLMVWWIVYSDAVRQSVTYAGLSVAQQNKTATPAKPTSSDTSGSAFGSATSSQSTPAFGSKPATPAFGAPAFGAPAFGSPGGGSMGQQSAWGSPAPSSTAATANTPSFGNTSSFGAAPNASAFGSASGLGSRGSPWASGTTASPFANASPANQGQSTGSPFQSNKENSSGGFGAYASKGGFGSAISVAPTSGSLFGKPESATSFTSDMDMDSSFGKPETPTVESKPSITSGGGAFKLGSTFQGNGQAANEPSKPSVGVNDMFGSGFNKALGDVTNNAVTESKDADMAGPGDENAPPQESTTAPVAKSPEALTPQNPVESQKEQKPSTPSHAEKSPEPSSRQKAQPSSSGSTEPSHDQKEQKSPAKEADLPPAPLPPSPKVKPEPADSVETPSGIDQRIPEAPLPPESTSKTSYAAGDSSASSTSTNRSAAEDLPLSREPASPSAKSSTSEEDEHEREHDDTDNEGSGEDIAKDISSRSAESESAKETPAGSFDEQSLPKSSVGGLFTHLSKPQPKDSSQPLFGELGHDNIPRFEAPVKGPESPRSPSPVRQGMKFATMPRLSPARPPTSFGIPTSPRAANESPTRASQSEAAFHKQQELSREEERRAEEAAVRAKIEEEQDLSDEEYEKVQEELASDVQGTLRLDPFIAHQDYVGRIDKPGIPGQVERVYRDINSMLDTLGLNARSLKSFIKGHSEQYKEGGRTSEDLENEDDWCLIEIEDLGIVENDLGEQLEEAKPVDVTERVGSCKDMLRDLRKLREKHNHIKTVLEHSNDPQQAEAARLASLSTEQSFQQQQTRRKFAHFQKLLTEAENGVSLLSAKLTASQPEGAGPFGAAPTMESVINIISKMTSMAQKRSADVDVLENTLRKLSIQSPSKSRSPASTPAPRSSHAPRYPYGSPARGRQDIMASSPLAQLAQSSPDLVAERTEAAKYRRSEKVETLRRLILEREPRVRAME